LHNPGRKLKAYWRALTASFSEKERLEYNEQLAKDEISWEARPCHSLSIVIAAAFWHAACYTLAGRALGRRRP
jgi:hypothetical protein